MKVKPIITVILLFCGTITNAQTYKSLFQVDRNGYGNLKLITETATIRFSESSIWIKYDELTEPMELYMLKNMGDKKQENSVETTYIFSDNTINSYGYVFLEVDKFYQMQTTKNGKYKVTFKIGMIDQKTFQSTGEVQPTRYTIFYSTLKQ